MNRLIVSGVLATALLAGSLFAISNAQALSAPAGLAAVIQNTNPVVDVAYVCRRVRACGPYGCGWRRQCWETGYGYGPGYGGGYYRGYGGYESPTAHVCGPGWSLQGGVCKPYRGP